MDKEKISIIIPVYNVEKYLERCLDSVTNQTYKNLEIILIDDGSKDKSGSICNKYLKKDKRIQVIHKKNMGVSVARNDGLKVISGEYVIFLDSDDWIQPDMIEKLYNNLITYDVDVSICNFYISVEYKKEYVKDSEGKNDLVIDNVIDMYNLIFDNKKVGGYLWNKLIRTSVIKNNEIYFNENVAIEEDVIFMIDVLKNCRKICYSPKNILYHYRQRKDSAVNFNYTLKDLTKLYSLEKKLEIKSKYSLSTLDKLEYNYVFLLKQSIYILKKENIVDKHLLKKAKKIDKNIYKIAFNEANNKQKIKLILITIFPKIYGKIVCLKK